MPIPHTALKTLARLAAAAPDRPTDTALLARYVATRDEEAFASLIDRHGRAVLGICRRALGHAEDAEDAEDAAQAVFLVLARNAQRVRKPEALSAWLHSIAVRVTGRALTRRTEAEPLPKAEPAAKLNDRTTWSDARRVIDEAL